MRGGGTLPKRKPDPASHLLPLEYIGAAGAGAIGRASDERQP